MSLSNALARSPAGDHMTCDTPQWDIARASPPPNPFRDRAPDLIHARSLLRKPCKTYAASAVLIPRHHRLTVARNDRTLREGHWQARDHM